MQVKSKTNLPVIIFVKNKRKCGLSNALIYLK